MGRTWSEGGLDAGDQRRIAVELFNETWALLERPARGADEDLRMLHMAHASRFHWGEVGEPVNLVRGEWQCSRVYSVLGRAEPARYHAERCLELCEANGIEDFDLAYAYEALARAERVGGDEDLARRYLENARAAAGRIVEAEDREHFLSNLADLEPS